MELDLTFYSVSILTLLALFYIFKHAIKVYKQMGRFASSMDAEGFSRFYKVTLHVNTTVKQSKFGSDNDKTKIFLFYNRAKKKFSPVINKKLIFVDTCRYSDFFYESLAHIYGLEKELIIHNVKRYFLKNFWRMKCFYRSLIDFRFINYIFGEPFLRFVPQNILKNPDKVLRYISEELREGAKLTLVDIDRFSNRNIRKLYNYDSLEKWKYELKKLLNIAKSHKKRKLTQIDTLHMGDTFNAQLSNSPNQIRFIQDEIKKCQTTPDNCHQLGSDRVGVCKLHALGVKLAPLFAADIINIFAKSHRTGKRVIFHYEPPGVLYYYSTLYHHQYRLLTFARRLRSIEDEMVFLACFNKAKYELNRNGDKFVSLMSLLQERWNLFDRSTQSYLISCQYEIHSLLREL